MENFDHIKRAASAFNVSSAPAPLTLEKAVEIFDTLADMEDIAFGYPDEGCYARAHIMCRRLVEMGLAPQKAWAFETERTLMGSLRYSPPEGPLICWGFHVAPTLSVKMPDGRQQDMVMDPAIFDGPVSIEDWGKIMCAKPEKLQIVPFGTPPEGHTGDYDSVHSTGNLTDALATSRMKNYLAFQKHKQRTVHPSACREQAFQNQGREDRGQGATWISARNSPDSAGQTKAVKSPSRDRYEDYDNPFLGI